MAEELKLQRLIIKGVVAELPQSDREKVEACADKLRQVIAENGQFGFVALALVVSEQDV